MFSVKCLYCSPGCVIGLSRNWVSAFVRSLIKLGQWQWQFKRLSAVVNILYLKHDDAEISLTFLLTFLGHILSLLFAMSLCTKGSYSRIHVSKSLLLLPITIGV